MVLDLFNIVRREVTNKCFHIAVFLLINAKAVLIEKTVYCDCWYTVRCIHLNNNTLELLTISCDNLVKKLILVVNY